MLFLVKANVLFGILLALSSLCVSADLPKNGSVDQNTQDCVLTFKNGDKLTAKYTSWTENRIFVESPYFTEKISFSKSLLSDIELKLIPQPKQLTDHQAVVTIISSTPDKKVKTSKEILVGQIFNYSKDSITIKPAFTEALIIPHSSILSIEIQNLSNILFHHFRHLDDWNHHNDSETWELDGETIKSSGNSHVSKDLSLTNKTHISFELFSKSKAFNLRFYADKGENGNLENYYELRLGGNSSSIQKFKDNRAVRMRARFAKKRRFTSKSDKKIKYDIYSNLSKGEFNLYINGQLAVTYNDDNLKKVHGKHVHLISKGAPQSIIDFTVKKWSGIHNTAEQANVKKNQVSGENIYLANGDILTGEILKVQNSHLVVKTDFAQFKTPLNCVTKLSTKTLKPKESLIEPNDFVILSKNNGRILVKGISSNKNLLTVKHSLWGEIDIDLNLISRIHIAR